MSNDKPTLRIPNIGYRGPTSSHEQNQAWRDVLFDQQRAMALLRDLEKQMQDYSLIFSLERQGLSQQIAALSEVPAVAEGSNPLYGRRKRVAFSRPSFIRGGDALALSDHGVVTLPVLSKVNKLTSRSLNATYFPPGAVRVQYLDVQGNVIELPIEATVSEEKVEFAIDDRRETYYFQKVSLPVDHPMQGLGLRVIAAIDDAIQQRTCNTLEIVPFPEHIVQIRQANLHTGRWGGIPSIPAPGSPNFEKRPLFSVPDYRGVDGGFGDQRLASRRQLHVFPKQDVVMAEIDLWQPQAIQEGDRKVFVLGVNGIFLGLSDFVESATMRFEIPRPEGGWSMVTRLDLLATLDGAPMPQSEALEVRMSYLRPDGVMGTLGFNHPMPNPESILVDVTLTSSPILKIPPLVKGLDLYYREGE